METDTLVATDVASTSLLDNRRTRSISISAVVFIYSLSTAVNAGYYVDNYEDFKDTQSIKKSSYIVSTTAAVIIMFACFLNLKFEWLEYSFRSGLRQNVFVRLLLGLLFVIGGLVQTVAVALAAKNILEDENSKMFPESIDCYDDPDCASMYIGAQFLGIAVPIVFGLDVVAGILDDLLWRQLQFSLILFISLTMFAIGYGEVVNRTDEEMVQTAMAGWIIVACADGFVMLCSIMKLFITMPKNGMVRVIDYMVGMLLLCGIGFGVADIMSDAQPLGWKLYYAQGFILVYLILAVGYEVAL